MSLGATVTSSDYSGYNILPPASFEGMTDLLWGLHKEDMSEFWQSSEIHGGLIVQEAGASNLQPTTKALGGNMGIRMSALTMLPPFFSPYYFYNKTPLLARGEDTLMGLAASRSHIFLDIQTPIFHDTYGDYQNSGSPKQQQCSRQALLCLYGLDRPQGVFPLEDGTCSHRVYQEKSAVGRWSESTIPVYKRQTVFVSSGYPVLSGGVAAGYGETASENEGGMG